MEKKRESTPVVANVQYGGAYRASLEEAARTGRCPFCDPEFQRSPDILHRVDGWFVLRSRYPTHDRLARPPHLQLLLVKESHDDLTTADWAAWGAMWAWSAREFDIRGGGFCVRIGDSTLSGRTILHPHAHILVPNLCTISTAEGEEREVAVPIDFPVG